MSDKITIEVSDLSKVSDGYHTIAELYEHRVLLWINLVLKYAIKDAAYHPNHYEGWDLLSTFTKHGQISYHVQSKYRYLYESKLPIDPELRYKFDGHTSQDVLKRLEALALS